MSYIIQTTQSKILQNLDFDDKEDVINAIQMFDLQPPFKIFDENKTDLTTEFLSRLADAGYSFIDKKQVIKLIPDDLKKLMNANYKKILSVKFKKLLNIKFVPVDDIKAVQGFYELWENKCITIGTAASQCIFLNTLDMSIGSTDFSNLKIPNKYEIITSSFSDFILKCKNSVK